MLVGSEEPLRAVLVDCCGGGGDDTRGAEPAGSRVRDCAPSAAAFGDVRGGVAAVGRAPPVDIGTAVVGRAAVAIELVRAAVDPARWAAAEDC